MTEQTTETLDPEIAPEPAPEPDPQPRRAERTFSREDIEKARQEERDKLYGKISKSDDRFKALQEEVSTLQEERKKREAEEAKRQKEIEKQLREKEKAELSAKELLEKTELTWQEKFEAMQNQMAEQEAIWAKEREYQELRNYIQQRVGEELAKETIPQEMTDFIGGNTVEEVEASIARVQEKAEAIMESIKAAQAGQRAAMPGVSTGGYTATGPIDGVPGEQKMTPEDIKNMSFEDYVKNRSKLGMGASRSQGLFS